MANVLVVALLLAAAPPGVVLQSDHAARALDEGVYQHIVTTPFKAKVSRGEGGEQLQIDVVRFGPARGPKEGAAAILVEIGDQSSTIPIRAPLEEGREVGGGLVASWPVRHRFLLPDADAPVSVTVVQGASGVGLMLSLAPATAGTELPPLVSLAPEPAEEPAEETPEPEQPAEKSPEPAPKPVQKVAAAPSDEPDEPDEPDEHDEPAPIASVEQPPPNLPVARLRAQVAVGGMVHLNGAVAPTLLSGGVRVLTGVRSGWLSRYGYGAALDFEHQAARGPQARWDVTTTRLRLETEAKALDLDLGVTTVDLTLLAGAGMILGAHHVRVGSVEQGALLLGPTFRVGAQAAASLGPGAIVALVPLDLSVDAVGGRVQGFAPLAASLYLGYRLDL